MVGKIDATNAVASGMVVDCTHARAFENPVLELLCMHHILNQMLKHYRTQLQERYHWRQITVIIIRVDSARAYRNYSETKSQLPVGMAALKKIK